MASRAAYLSRLRRAFLVRAHPDRLHSFHDSDVRSRQASAVQAIIQRLQESDVSAWQQSAGCGTLPRKVNFQTVRCLVIPLGQKKGNAQTAKLRLGGTVDEVLADIAMAVRQSGAADIPLPTLSTPLNQTTNQTTSQIYGKNHKNPPKLQGRVLKDFLSSIELSTIDDRKLARVEAHAAAASVRNAFGFAMVDATKIGWSSKSVAVLLRRLLSLHVEFSAQIRPSFYPWKLSYSSSVIEDGAIDEYGGKILLNPAATNVQWLQGLQSVTDATNTRMLQIREDIEKWRKALQEQQGMRLMKGFTCSSQDYYCFLKRLMESRDTATEEIPSSNLPRINSIDAVVEDMLVCVKPEVTNAGSIMLGSSMNASVCKAAFDRLSSIASDRRSLFKEERILTKTMAHQAQNVLGLERISFDERTLSHEDFRKSVGRLIAASNQFEIASHLLNIIATDRFCYIGDDGALAIPHNWC